MDPQCSASVGSAAIEIVQDPALAEVGVASEERIAGQCGQSAIQDGCDEKPQDALVRNSSEKMTAEDTSPTQHAASQVPTGSSPLPEVRESDDPRVRFLELQRQRSGVHWSLIPWFQIVDEIKRGIHRHALRGDRCRNPKCGCYANELVMDFFGYCCKQCAFRLRE